VKIGPNTWRALNKAEKAARAMQALGEGTTDRPFLCQNPNDVSTNLSYQCTAVNISLQGMAFDQSLIYALADDFVFEENLNLAKTYPTRFHGHFGAVLIAFVCTTVSQFPCFKLKADHPTDALRSEIVHRG
jgi:hypothetical protein